jgi:gliding motility-associated-like protein
VGWLTSFSIYNRWGQLVYQTNMLEQGWNGKYKGTILPGVYVWKLKAVDYNNKVWYKDGLVTLIQ